MTALQIGIISHIQQNKAVKEAKPIGDHIGKVESVPNIVQLPNDKAYDEKQQQEYRTDLVPDLNVYENVILPVELDGRKVDVEYVDGILELLGLAEKREALPGTISGRQQQRVAIARALAAKPAIILADEPTGNLDSVTSHDVLGLLKMAARQFSQTLILITHDRDIAQLADRIVHIVDGKIVGVTRKGSDSYACQSSNYTKDQHKISQRK